MATNRQRVQDKYLDSSIFNPRGILFTGEARRAKRQLNNLSVLFTKDVRCLLSASHMYYIF